MISTAHHTNTTGDNDVVGIESRISKTLELFGV